METTSNKLKVARVLAAEVHARSERIIARAETFLSCRRCGHVVHLTQHAMGAHYRCDVDGCECGKHHHVCKPQNGAQP